MSHALHPTDRAARKRVFAALACGSALLLAACSGGGAGPATTTDDPAPASSSTTPAPPDASLPQVPQVTLAPPVPSSDLLSTVAGAGTAPVSDPVAPATSDHPRLLGVPEAGGGPSDSPLDFTQAYAFRPAADLVDAFASELDAFAYAFTTPVTATDIGPLATALGLPAPERTGQQWVSASPAGGLLVVEPSGRWTYRASQEPGAPTVGDDDLFAAADRLVDATPAGAYAGERHLYRDEQLVAVTVALRIDGQDAPVVFDVVFAADGTVASASGLLHAPQRAGSFALASPMEALERLTLWGGGRYVPLPGQVGQEVEQVVTSVDLGIVAVEDRAGTLWLLPAYRFASADGGMWQTVAVADRLLGHEGATPPDLAAVTATPAQLRGRAADFARRIEGVPVADATRMADGEGWSVFFSDGPPSPGEVPDGAHVVATVADGVVADAAAR